MYSSSENERRYDESCSDTFCYQTIIQQRLLTFGYICSPNIFNSSFNKPFQSYPCGYTFLVTDSAYNFSMIHFINFNRSNRFLVVMDWAMRNKCSAAQKNSSSYVCKSKYSECQNAKV
ncbi:hypothetical protein V8G54_007411 [Vigna mungo]|uniref:Uncharacterized protein n=1 Tax=Vigna mungo TaxID=3915 RepID=A0AAQ3S918_VIGMU